MNFGSCIFKQFKQRSNLMATSTVSSGRKTLKDTTAADTFNIGGDATSVTIAGKMTKGDVINVEGLASEYSVSASGRTITLKSDTQTIKFQLATTGGEASIRFLDGDLTATYGGTKVGASLGGVKLVSKAVMIDDSKLGTTDSSAIDFSGSSSSGGGSSGGSTSGTAYSLTGGADVIKGNSDDNAITSTLGTLSTLDDIDGGAGTDSLTVTFAPIYATAGSATAAAPTISNVETITLTNNAASASFDMGNVDTAVKTLEVNGRADLTLSAMNITAVTVGMSANLTLNLATATASTAAYGMTVNVKNGTAATLIFDEDAGLTAADTLTLNAVGNFGNGTTGQLDASGIESLVVKGAGNVDINLSSAALSAIAQDLTGIDASQLGGTLTVRLGSSTADLALQDLNIAGGSGADVITYLDGLTTNDSIDGNGGSDVLNAALSGGYLRPTITEIETFNFLVNSGATADFRDISSVSTINLLLASGATLDKLGSSVTTLTVNSSDATANGLIFNYGTAAGASTVTLNLGNGIQGTQQATAATATAMGVSGISFSGNSGSLNVVANSTASYSANSLTANDFTAVTINASSGSLTFGDDINLGTAQTVTLRAGAAATLTAVDLSAMGANSISIAADGISAAVGFGTGYIGTANTVTISTNSAMTGNQGVTINSLLLQSGADSTAGTELSTLTINALGGDVTIGSAAGSGLVFLSGATSINLSVDVNLGASSVLVDLNGINVSSIASAATASEQAINIDLDGTGSFDLTGVAINCANLTLSINSTGLSTASLVTIDLSLIDDTGTVVSAVFGNHSGTFVGGDGADTIELGLGAMTVNGGLGADTITLNNTAAHRVDIAGGASAAGAAAQGVDTIIGVGSGDVILFSAAGSAAGGTAHGGSAAFSTGTATDVAQIRTASYTAVVNSAAVTATDQLAIYTSNGDTIIEVLLATASATGAYSLSAATAGDQFARVILSNKDFTAITAAFQVNTTGSGLSITLL